MTGNSNQPMSDTQIRLANELLEWLLANSHKENWSGRIEDVFPGSEYETVIASVERVLSELGFERPVSVYIGSTASLKKDVSFSDTQVDSDQVQLAIQSLKDNYRILQLGRGRGRAIVVLDSEKLRQGDTFKIKHTAPTHLAPLIASTSSEATITW